MSKDAAVRHFEGDLVFREAVRLSPVEEERPVGSGGDRDGGARPPLLPLPPRAMNKRPLPERGVEPRSRSAVFLDAASGVSEAPFSLEAGFGGNAALPEAGLQGGLLHASMHHRARPVTHPLPHISTERAVPRRGTGM